MSTMPQQQSRPGFIDERTGWSRLKQLLFLEPLPGGSRWTAAFGSLLLFVFALQAITGILLTMNYAASVDTAYPSVKYIQEEVPLGAFIRSLHHWGSSAMVVLLLFHLVQVYVWGAYKKPRELTWMVGVLLLICILGLAFTGYLLPWDAKAYWATKVGLGILSTTPWIGGGLRILLQGGPEMGNLTLTRFFTLHAFLLPGLVVFLVMVHLYLFRVNGVTPSWWESEAQLKAKEEPFWPGQVWKDGVLALVFLLGLGLWCAFRPASLEEAANPAKPYEARPEWYFMFLFELLRYFKGPYEVVGTFYLPALFFLVLFFWPFLDRSPQRDPRRRPISIGLFGTATAALVGMTIFAVVTDVRMHEPAQAVAEAPPAPPPAGPIQLLEVAQLYSSQCAACHGVDGSGKQLRAGMPTIPNFTSLAWQMSQTDLEITHRIVDGNEPLMPAFRDKLTREQNLALTIYVRAFVVDPNKPSAPPAIGKEPTPAAQPEPSHMAAPQLYRAYCMACHDTDGRGKLVRAAMPEIPDFTTDKWQTDHSDAEIGKSIRDGKGKFMLPMKDKLGTADVEHLIAYMRAFRGGTQVAAEEPKLPIKSPDKPIIEPAPPVVPGKEPKTRPPADEDRAARTRVASTLYRQYCLTCHGTDGKGKELRANMPELPDFTSHTWQESRENPQFAVSILDGKGKLMPSFRGRVKEDQVPDLVAYVRAFGPVKTPDADQPPASEFEEQYRRLQKEWDALQKQLDELPKGKPPKPSD
jgi:quinol-cytochrome oxidoreductase complex cytochrome b subunit/mono/diheme cytochrome c family protein